jgi:hypothetical protein
MDNDSVSNHFFPRLNMEGFISTIRNYELDLVAVDESQFVYIFELKLLLISL